LLKLNAVEHSENGRNGRHGRDEKNPRLQIKRDSVPFVDEIV
jgi:hypothetical protein